MNLFAVARTLSGGKLALCVRAARIALRGEALWVWLPARAAERRVGQKGIDNRTLRIGVENINVIFLEQKM